MPESTLISSRRLVRFARGHVAYVALLPLLVVVGSMIHGGAAAAAIVAGGGNTFDWFFHPWSGAPIVVGGFAYTLTSSLNPWQIVLAPVAVWIWVAVAGSFVAPRLGCGHGARLAAVFSCLLPSLAISSVLAILACFDMRRNYFAVVYEHPAAAASGGAVVLAVLALLGHGVFQRVWGTAMSRLEFAIAHIALLAVPWVILAITGSTRGR